MSKISFNKNYLFLDQNGELAKNQEGKLASVSLNIFQRFFRLLGFYSNTHLSKIQSAVVSACFDSNWSQKDKQNILNVTRKAIKLIDKFSFFSLGQEHLESGENLKYRAYLNSSLDYCQFDITVEKADKAAHVIISMEQSKDKITLTKITKEIGSRVENDLLVRIAHAFWLKIKSNSHNLTETKENFEATKIKMRISGTSGGSVAEDNWDEMKEFLENNQSSMIELRTPLSVDFLIKTM